MKMVHVRFIPLRVHIICLCSVRRSGGTTTAMSPSRRSTSKMTTRPSRWSARPWPCHLGRQEKVMSLDPGSPLRTLCERNVIETLLFLFTVGQLHQDAAVRFRDHEQLHAPDAGRRGGIRLHNPDRLSWEQRAVHSPHRPGGDVVARLRGIEPVMPPER